MQLRLWNEECNEYSKLHEMIEEMKSSHDRTRKRLFGELAALKAQMRAAGLIPASDLPLFHNSTQEKDLHQSQSKDCLAEEQEEVVQL